MNRVPLLILLWAVSFIRAIMIVACSLAVYVAVAFAFFSVDFSKTDNVVIPAIVAALLFFYLLASDASWVENEVKRYTV